MLSPFDFAQGSVLSLIEGLSVVEASLAQATAKVLREKISFKDIHLHPTLNFPAGVFGITLSEIQGVLLMRIFLAAKSVYPFHPVGGVQKYVYYFAQALTRRGVDVAIVAPLHKGASRRETYDGLTYHFIPPKIYPYLEYPVGWLGVHLFSRNLAKYLQNKEFDLLHSFDLAGYGYLKKRVHRPVVAQVFTDNYLSNPISFNPFGFWARSTDAIKKTKVLISPFAAKTLIARYPLQYFLKIKPMHFLLRNADGIFFEEDRYRRDVRDVFQLSAQRTAVVPVGIDFNRIQTWAKEGCLARESLGLSVDDFVLMTVNRLAADKGVDKLVEALALLKDRYPKLKLLIVGQGYLEKEINELIVRRQLATRVVHLKNLSEEKLYPTYALANLYVCAFSYPGSSISTLEAMACGLPLLTTAQPWLVQGGENGTFVSSHQPSVLAEAIEGLMQKKDLSRMGEVSRRLAQDYDWDRIADTALQEYKDILQGSY